MALLQKRRFLSPALEFLRELRSSPAIEIINVGPTLQAHAWDLYRRWSRSGGNPVDCASFAVMQSLSIRKTFTFDRHFQNAGFEILR